MVTSLSIIIIMLLAIPLYGGAIVGQIFICRIRNHFLGLILPILSIIASIIVAKHPLLIILLNIPTYAMIAIYVAAEFKRPKKAKRPNKKEIDKRASLNIQRVTSGEKIFRQSKQKFARIVATSAKNFCDE